MISIVVPCYNEEGNLIALVQRLDNSLKNFVHEIILIDDGSKDRTFEIGTKLESSCDHVKIYRHSKNLGIAHAWRTGIKKVSFDITCFIDADLQNPPEAIEQMLEYLQSTQLDFVQGARSSIGRLKDQRMALSRGLNFLLNFVFGQEALDSKSGFILGYTAAFHDVLDYKLKYRYFQTFLGVVIRNKGYRVNEIETLFDSREVGVSFISKRNPVNVVFGVLLDFIPAYIEFRKKTKFIGKELIKPVRHRQKNFLRQFFFNFYFATSKLHKWIISADSKNLYYWLKTTEFLSREKLDEIQQKRLRQLILHAYHNVPYYRKVFSQNGLDLQSLKSINELPFLTKSDVRKNLYFSMFSKDHIKKQMHKIQTSGSTGHPFVCYADKFQLEMRFATTLRALEMTGWRFGDRQLRLWHQTLGMSRKQAFQEKLDAWFLRRKFIPAFEMTPESIESLFKLIDRFKPKLIDGYAESFNFIASATNFNLHHKPIALMSSAQQLTPRTRERIEDKFKSRVYDKYGSREFSGIAYQCADGPNHHVQDESYIVELLVDGRPAKPGEVGEIVITDLNNFSVPLIRYRIGDLAVAVEQNPCKCGRSHMQIGEITGRTQALVACSNGVWLPGTFFAHFFKEYEFAINQYQVYQEFIGKFEVRIIPSARYNESVQSNILSALHHYTSKKTDIKFIIVSEIPMEKTGKRTPVVSKVSQEFQFIKPGNIVRKLVE